MKSKYNEQLKRLKSFKKRRTEIKAAYDVMLSGIDGIEVPAQRDYVDPMWHLYPLRVPAKLRRAVFEKLRSTGFGVQVNYLPAYRHPAFEGIGFSPSLCPVAEDYYNKEISLPLYTGLTDANVAFVVTAVASAAN